MKNTIIIIIILIIFGGALYLFTRGEKTEVANEQPSGTDVVTEDMDGDMDDDVTEPEEMDTMKPQEVIGSSVEDRDIIAYHFGDGDTEVLFVGGIHGGYSWNTALVGYELIDYLETNPSAVPDNVTVTVIPALNPDGLYSVTGKEGAFTNADVQATEVEKVAARFNGNNVDLNRNFDCDWQAEGTWQDKMVSGGAGAFSEPESQAVRDYVSTNAPDAVVAYYSAAGGVYSSTCHNGILPETTTLTNLYADASGYTPYKEFDYYEITGDMVNWFAKNGVPAISVLLTDHTNSEWSKNQKGIDALLNHYAE